MEKSWPRFIRRNKIPISSIFNPCDLQGLRRNGNEKLPRTLIQPQLLRNTQEQRRFEWSEAPAHTQSTRNPIISYLSAAIEQIRATQPGEDLLLRQPTIIDIGRTRRENSTKQDGVIGRELGIPNEIGGGSGAEGSIQGGEFADLGRLQEHENNGNTILRHVVEGIGRGTNRNGGVLREGSPHPTSISHQYSVFFLFGRFGVRARIQTMCLKMGRLRDPCMDYFFFFHLRGPSKLDQLNPP